MMLNTTKEDILFNLILSYEEREREIIKINHSRDIKVFSAIQMCLTWLIFITIIFFGIVTSK